MGTSIMGKYGGLDGNRTNHGADSTQPYPGTTPLEEFGDDLFELLPFYNAATRHSRCFCRRLIMSWMV